MLMGLTFDMRGAQKAQPFGHPLEGLGVSAVLNDGLPMHYFLQRLSVGRSQDYSSCAMDLTTKSCPAARWLQPTQSQLVSSSAVDGDPSQKSGTGADTSMATFSEPQRGQRYSKA